MHGHDEGARESVARFIEHIGFEPMILHERPNKGRTIITKFREEAACRARLNHSEGGDATAIYDRHGYDGTDGSHTSQSGGAPGDRASAKLARPRA